MKPTQIARSIQKAKSRIKHSTLSATSSELWRIALVSAKNVEQKMRGKGIKVSVDDDITILQADYGMDMAVATISLMSTRYFMRKRLEILYDDDHYSYENFKRTKVHRDEIDFNSKDCLHINVHEPTDLKYTNNAMRILQHAIRVMGRNAQLTYQDGLRGGDRPTNLVYF